MKKLLLAGAFAVLLSACGGDTLDSGYVTKKIYDDPDQWMQCVGQYYGSTYNPCASQIWHTDPERWLIDVSDCQNPGEGCKKDTWELAHDKWEETKVGDPVRKEK